MATDPLAEIVTLLQPAARLSKLVECAGAWRLHREETGEPFYCAILEGRCRVTFGNQQPIILQAGDFVLAPAMRNLVSESIDAPSDLSPMVPTGVSKGRFRVGRDDAPADVRMRVGHCSFGAPDSALLVSL
ncbi:MAG: cupin domain-containing protein, partial [Rhizobium sp.]